MSNKYHQRVIILNYSEDDVPAFTNQADQNAWYQALGRMVAYNLQPDAVDDSTQIVTGHLRRNPLEICLSYPPPAVAVRDDDGYRVHSGTKSIVDHHIWEAERRMRDTGRSFTMGAVLHNDNKWGFHS